MLGLAEPVLAIHQHRAGEAELSDARRDLGVGERLRSLVGIRDERIDRQDPVRVKLAPWYKTVWHQTPKRERPVTENRAGLTTDATWAAGGDYAFKPQGWSSGIATLYAGSRLSQFQASQQASMMCS